MYDEVLGLVEKPIRYIGQEWNQIVKPHEGRPCVALAFPDSYEIGMSHLGLRILYDLLNRQHDFAAERVFCPWVDMEAQLRRFNLPLATLQQAFRTLDDPAVDVVIGPCDDGGYYLIGLKAPCSALFREVTMSTATVRADTQQRAQEHGLRVVCLPTWYDVDTYKDLLRLREALAAHPDHPARHTRAFLSHTAGQLHPRGERDPEKGIDSAPGKD